MNLIRHWKIILSLVAIFVAGTITGSVLTLRVVKRVATSQYGMENWIHSTLRDLKRKLKLTPEQVEQLQPVLEKRSQELKAIRSESFREVFFVLRGLDDEISVVLSPEQKVAHEKMRAEFRARLRERFKEKLPES